MRLFATLFALLVAAPASGQDADPDTTDPASYVPLEVGNRWEYTPDPNDIGPYVRHFRTMIVADTTIDGERWFVRREQTFLKEGRAHVLETDRREAVRFDSGAATVVRWTGTEAVLDFPCRLDGPLGEHADACADGPYVSYAKGPETVDVAGRSVESVVVRFDGAVPGPTFVAGVGDIGQTFEGRGGRDLAFASVGGETYGEPVEGLPNLPDPTPPWMYYPLAVGNVWEYRVDDGSGGLRSRSRHEIVADSIIGAHLYFVETRAVLQANGTWGLLDESRLLRFEAASGRVVARDDAGGEAPATCPLGADFFAMLSEDAFGCRETGSFNPAAPGVKEYLSGAINSYVYEAGVGFTRFGSPFEEIDLTYALVGGVERGTPYPVAEDGTPDPDRLGVRLSPNPALGPVAVALTLPEAGAVTAEAFDALGRRVARTEAVLPAGAQQIDLDAGAWAPGLYVVRVTAGEATASGTVVRR